MWNYHLNYLFFDFPQLAVLLYSFFLHLSLSVSLLSDSVLRCDYNQSYAGFAVKVFELLN